MSVSRGISLCSSTWIPCQHYVDTDSIHIKSNKTSSPFRHTQISPSWLDTLGCLQLWCSLVCLGFLSASLCSTPSVLPDIARERSKQAYENKPKTSDFSVRGKKKKKKEKRERLLHFANTQISPWIQEYHCIHYCFYMLWSLFCFSSRTSKQYDMQYNRTIYKRLYRKKSPKSLIISWLGNCEHHVS